MTLSFAEAVCVMGSLGRGKMKDRGERWEGEKAGEPRGFHLFPLPIVHHAITFS